MHLKEIMTSPVATVTPVTSLADAAKKMLALDIGLLPVSNGREIVGIVSDRDITIRGVAKGMDPERTDVQEVMSKEVFTCPVESDVNVRPPSVVTKRYGLKSFQRWLSNATYAVSES